MALRRWCVYLLLLTSVVCGTRNRALRETALEQNRLSGAYRDRLKKGLEHFRCWIGLHKPKALRWEEDVQAVNQVLADYVNACRLRGESMWLPKHAILAVQTWIPGYRGKLHRPWDCLRTWRAQEFLGSRPPLQREILYGLFGVALDLAFAGGTNVHLWFCFGILVRVGYSALLRPGELLALRARDVLFSWDSIRGQNVAVLALEHPKNAKAMGLSQFTTVDDPAVARWLQWLVADVPSDYSLWPSSRNAFLSCWRHALDVLGLTNLNFTPGSLRPGGATTLFLEGMEVARLKFRGRWKSESALSCYIQEAVSTLVWNQVSTKSRLVLKQWEQVVSFCWSTPPQVPWSRFFNRGRQWRSSARKTRPFASRKRLPISPRPAKLK